MTWHPTRLVNIARPWPVAALCALPSALAGWAEDALSRALPGGVLSVPERLCEAVLWARLRIGLRLAAAEADGGEG